MWCLERMNTCSAWVIMPKARVREVVYDRWVRPATFTYTAPALQLKIGLTTKSPLFASLLWLQTDPRICSCTEMIDAKMLQWKGSILLSVITAMSISKAMSRDKNVNRAFLRKAIYLPPWFIIQWHVGYFFFVTGTRVHNNKVLDLKVFGQPFQSAM